MATNNQINAPLPLAVAQGGTGVTSVTIIPSPTAFAGWDANNNMSANNFIFGYATTATASGTTTLLVGSAGQQFFTGTLNQNLKMPVANTLAVGQSWTVVNNSSGIITIQSSGGNTILALPALSETVVTVVTASGTTASSWVTSPAVSGSGTVASGSINQLAYYAAAGTTVSGLATGNSGVLVTSASGVPSISSTLPPAIIFGTYAITAVSGVTTLSASAYGTEVVATGSSAYTITLPAVAAEAWIDFSIRTTSNALITLSPASGTINGQANIKLGTYEQCRLVSDGTNWFIKGLMLQPVNCVAYSSTSQTSIGTAVKVLYNNVTFDIGGFFDTATNHRYTPLYPGKYLVSPVIDFQDTLVAIIATGYIYKNGSSVAISTGEAINGNNAISLAPSLIVSMNGSTDYVEAFVAGNGTHGNVIVTSSANTYFNITRIALF